MRYIGIYDWPLCESMRDYRGLYRGNSLLLEPNIPPALLQAFFQLSNDGSSTQTSAYGLHIFKQVLEKIQNCKHTADLLLFSDEPGVSLKDDSFQCIGYDICADSAYYSPIGAGLLKEVLQQGIQHHRISAENAAKLDLNRYRLFSAYDVAQFFALLCNTLQQNKEYEFESETGWRPYEIWLYTKE